jgi:hypothetical protein
MIDYGKLSEQYAGFLVAIGGVSITVLTLVLSIWHLKFQSRGDDLSKCASDPVEENNHPALIFSLIIATFCCFVGAHLMAETAAFVSGLEKGAGRKPFLFASLNIFIGVTVVIFAVMLLATEYKKENPNTRGFRWMSMIVFMAVVFCVFFWVVVSVVWRMPAPERLFPLIFPFGGILILLGVVCSALWVKDKDKKDEDKKLYKFLLLLTFIPIILFTVTSLIIFSFSLLETNGGEIQNLDIIFFVGAITFTCLSLIISGYVMVWKGKNLSLLPQEKRRG